LSNLVLIVLNILVVAESQEPTQVVLAFIYCISVLPFHSCDDRFLLHCLPFIISVEDELWKSHILLIIVETLVKTSPFNPPATIQNKGLTFFGWVFPWVTPEVFIFFSPALTIIDFFLAGAAILPDGAEVGLLLHL